MILMCEDTAIKCHKIIVNLIAQLLDIDHEAAILQIEHLRSIPPINAVNQLPPN